MTGKIPAFCPLCDCVMKWKQNTETYIKYRCCVNCFIQFVEGREDRWKSGWRPSQEQLDRYKEQFYRRTWPGEES